MEVRQYLMKDFTLIQLIIMSESCTTSRFALMLCECNSVIDINKPSKNVVMQYSTEIHLRLKIKIDKRCSSQKDTKIAYHSF